MSLPSPARLTAAVAGVAVATAALTACGEGGERAGGESAALAELPSVPAGSGTLSMTDPAYAVGATVHVGDDVVTFPARVGAWVRAQGRVWAVLGDDVWVADDTAPQDTGYDADNLHVSESGDRLGLLDQAHGMPWSSVVVDLTTGRPVVRDSTGMGDETDDLSDLYEDAQPTSLGFREEALLVAAAEGNSVLAFDADGSEPVDLGASYGFTGGERQVGRRVGVIIRGQRVVTPADPARARSLGTLSPDGDITIVDTTAGTRFHDTASGEVVPVDVGAERFVVGGWFAPRTPFGVRYDGDRPGSTTVLVTCRIPAYGATGSGRCTVLERIDTPGRQQVLFPTGRNDLF